MAFHTLYSYRRCPYAMRARMALVSAKIQCRVYDIDFKDKPEAMLKASPKGTVPVLIFDGQVIDESLDIVNWALSQNDPEGWSVEDTEGLIHENDGPFKAALDRYKYPNRFPDEDCSNAQEQGLEFLKKMNGRLEKAPYLNGNQKTIIDICIFPFIRQFANVNQGWFENLDLKPLQNWLAHNLESEIFLHVMKKHKNSPYDLL